MQSLERLQHWPALSNDAFFSGAIHVLQPQKGYRAGIDAVLLAASLDITQHTSVQVLDVGAGVGVAGLAVAVRCKNAFVTMVEKQEVLVEIARENVLRNQLQNRINVQGADLLTPDAMHILRQGLFDHVISNPPYYDDHAIRHSANELKAASNAMARGALESWIKFMAMATKPGGTATIVHLAERLGQILQYFAAHFGCIAVQPLYSREGEKASRVLVRGIRASKAAMQIRPGIVLHTCEGAFQPDIERVLRHAALWSIW